MEGARLTARSSAPVLPQPESLAVLPFGSTAADPKVAAFGNGLVETLTAKLTQLGANHSLQVIPASEMREKRVTTLEQARQEFGVNLGLQAGLENSGEMLRANYTLIDAKTGGNDGTQSATVSGSAQNGTYYFNCTCCDGCPPSAGNPKSITIP